MNRKHGLHVSRAGSDVLLAIRRIIATCITTFEHADDCSTMPHEFYPRGSHE